MNEGVKQTRRSFFVIFQMLSWMFLPTARQKLPPRWRAGKSSTGFGAVVQHRLAFPRERSSRRKTLLSHRLTLREHVHARSMRVIHCRVVVILHSTIATRQIFPNHCFDVIGFFESVSREARVFESRIDFFEPTRLICLMRALNA
ncbi:hypothetical protein ACVW1C_006669 [Bradyrhizobium sp. USDA 4011]